ncbi:thioredoxin family protein [Synechocystis sp. LKSZ1]|uniref:thioredoxin family protein n=1 Tax=Synechocystis sp. LKSZ1 TaxID=3144951 RepID=UPI00336BFD9A
MSLLEITDLEFAQELANTEQPVLVYFWAEWCGPCRLMSPSVKAIADQYDGRLKVLKLAVDPNPQSVAQCQVEGVPALRLFKQGNLVLSHEGAITKPKLLELLEPVLP